MSDQAFASLTPANALARLAFSQVYDAFAFRHQNSQTDGNHDVLRHMLVDTNQKRDDEIIRLRRESESTKADTDGEASATLTEPDTDTEKQIQDLGMIWVGRYLLNLKTLPARPEKGWAVGKGPLETMPIDLLLCTRAFAKKYNISLRNPHARFNFSVDNRGLFIAGTSRSPTAMLAVNGHQVTRLQHHLNQHEMTIQFDRLEYNFQWTDYASTDDFSKDRKDYMNDNFSGQSADDIDVEMPTPLPNRRTIGKWTLRDPLGAGIRGRVFFASDSSGKIAAVKILERTSKNWHLVHEEVRTFEELNEAFAQSPDRERIVRMDEVIYTDDKQFTSKANFDNVAIVLTPMTPITFADLIETERSGGTKGMTMRAATAFREALLGVKLMHDKGWVHRDLKPANIGVRGQNQSVLLDVATSKLLNPNETLSPRPGSCGTIGYLAPELEMDNHDHSIDIWAMGVILFELTYNRHPWRIKPNPWRDDNPEFRAMRPEFHNAYQDAISIMVRDYKIARVSPDADHIHLGGLFVAMVRHKWAPRNNARRPDINEVLQHPAWGPLLPDIESSQAKRQRH